MAEARSRRQHGHDVVARLQQPDVQLAGALGLFQLIRDRLQDVKKIVSRLKAAGRGEAPDLLRVSSDGLPDSAGTLLRARSFAEPLIAHESLDTGENVLAHADAVAAILSAIGGSEAMQAACYLVYAGEHLNHPFAAFSNLRALVKPVLQQQLGLGTAQLDREVLPGAPRGLTQLWRA